MKALARGSVAIAFLTMAGPASAHAVFGMTGFSGGLLHPLVPAHLLALVALALLIGQQGWGRGVFIVYMTAVLTGLAAIALAYVPTFAEMAVLALAAICGAMVALGRPFPRIMGWVVCAAAGLALALDSPPEAIELRDANLALLGTALSAALALPILSWVASFLARGWRRIGARIVGSWIAASAFLVLALRLLR